MKVVYKILFSFAILVFTNLAFVTSSYSSSYSEKELLTTDAWLEASLAAKGDDKGKGSKGKSSSNKKSKSKKSHNKSKSKSKSKKDKKSSKSRKSDKKRESKKSKKKERKNKNKSKKQDKNKSKKDGKSSVEDTSNIREDKEKKKRKKKKKSKKSNEKAKSYQVDINKANAKELAKKLDGIGEKKAQAIIDYRREYGDFESIDDLLKVKGIGKETISKNTENIFIPKSIEE